MTVPVPAGAGGVDREALVLRRAFAADRSDDMAKVYVQDVGDLLAALAAAEQRADTAEAESAERDHRAYEHGISIGRALMMGRVKRAKQRADTLAAAIGRAADIHRPDTRVLHVESNSSPCRECGHDYPCPTVAALSSRPVQPEGKQT